MSENGSSNGKPAVVGYPYTAEAAETDAGDATATAQQAAETRARE